MFKGTLGMISPVCTATVAPTTTTITTSTTTSTTTAIITTTTIATSKSFTTTATAAKSISDSTIIVVVITSIYVVVCLVVAALLIARARSSRKLGEKPFKAGLLGASSTAVTMESGPIFVLPTTELATSFTLVEAASPTANASEPYASPVSSTEMN